jgi:hypothetical protein
MRLDFRAFDGEKAASLPPFHEDFMEELVARVAAAAGIDGAKAQGAVGLILAFLKKEAPPADVEALFEAVPGAAEAASAAETSNAGGGVLGGLAGMLGGGGLMGLAAKLTGIGLSMGEMTTTGKEFFAFAREKAGDERVGQVVAAIPGLSELL